MMSEEEDEKEEAVWSCYVDGCLSGGVLKEAQVAEIYDSRISCNSYSAECSPSPGPYVQPPYMAKPVLPIVAIPIRGVNYISTNPDSSEVCEYSYRIDTNHKWLCVVIDVVPGRVDGRIRLHVALSQGLPNVSYHNCLESAIKELSDHTVRASLFLYPLELFDAMGRQLANLTHLWTFSAIAKAKTGSRSKTKGPAWYPPAGMDIEGASNEKNEGVEYESKGPGYQIDWLSQEEYMRYV